MDAVQMPDRVAENLLLYIRQNDGVLSKSRREGEFKELRDDEASLIEGIERDAFGDF
jgi:hypothetical protein